MEGERVIVEILAVGVMNHGPSTVKRTNREFTNWDFRGRANKSGSPLSRNQFLHLRISPSSGRVPAQSRESTPDGIQRIGVGSAAIFVCVAIANWRRLYCGIPKLSTWLVCQHPVRKTSPRQLNTLREWEGTHFTLPSKS